MDPHPHIPIIFVIDWDGTIAGKVDFQSHRYSMQLLLKKYGYKASSQQPPTAFYPDQGLIRPGLVEWMGAMQQMYQNNCYFFIYTASERKWATQEVGWIERTHGIKFARPLFCRDDCLVDGSGNYKKSLAKIFPRVCRVVAKRTPLTNREKQYMLDKRTLAIDNSNVFNETDKCLLCPTYGYAFYEDLLDGFPKAALAHPVVQQHVLSLVNEGLVCPPHGLTGGGGSSGNGVAGSGGAEVGASMHQMFAKYRWLAVKCKSIVDANAAFEGDRFWKVMSKLLLRNNIIEFTPSVVRQLTKLVWKRSAPT